MPFLHQTFTDYNLEEFTRFNMIVPFRISKFRSKFLTVCYILMIFSGFLRVFTDPGTSAFTYLLIVFAIPLVLVYVSKRQCRKVYNANPELQNRHSVMRFYEDHLQETSNHQSVDIPYSSIAHLVETRTHFYLMTAANQGMIIVKANCSAELIQFIRGLKK
ncbi:hypothetical protein DXB18_07780 [Clostridium sp. OM02-18AC]|uniref:YcxB family protein n=1 Tax=Clostridium sp. OM02-18AC TaxID=2292311 RepID=UPI000E5230AB|nr:YcxB family protein [Clostridium sp. OM02-18AC]RHV66205.1 hypothetical protein DXB18_07780 [Clostridium sp. OM02-18AC]